MLHFIQNLLLRPKLRDLLTSMVISLNAVFRVKSASLEKSSTARSFAALHLQQFFMSLKDLDVKLFAEIFFNKAKTWLKKHAIKHIDFFALHSLVCSAYRLYT